jgi:hypothetical protein
MLGYFSSVLNNGSLWLLLACLLVLAGVVIGLFTRRGSEIGEHPYSKPELGGELGSDLPPESIGRPEFEPVLWHRRRRRRGWRRSRRRRDAGTWRRDS